MELLREVVSDIHVRHEPSSFMGPAMLHVSAVTASGTTVVIRRIQGDPYKGNAGIGSGRINRKLEDAQRIFGILVGQEISFINQRVACHGGHRAYFRIHWPKMPAQLRWMKGSWQELRKH